MALMRFEPIGELNTIQNEMNRLFNTFFEQPQAGRSGAQRRWTPAMDLVEAGDHYLLHADLPGVGEDDVSVQLEGNVLTISGQRTAEHADRQGYYRLERSFGTFSRSLTLPEGVDPDQVQARFDRGVLQVTIPKPEQRRPRQVQIQLTRSDEEPAAIEGTETAEPAATDRGPELASA